MRACAEFAAACILGALVWMPQTATTAAELVILTNQGATPGVRELAAAFARMSGHKVTVMQEEGAALERRINSGPADLVTGNPPTIEQLVKNGRVVANTVTAGLVSVKVGTGTPKSLVLEPGTYWLAWQVDTNRPVASYVPAVAGSGFWVAGPFGAFPSELVPGTATEAILTGETWTGFLVYALPVGSGVQKDRALVGLALVLGTGALLRRRARRC